MSQSKDDVALVHELEESVRLIKAELAKVIIGQSDAINKLLVSLFSKGHCLLVGVPGLAKTLLIKTVADVLDLRFGRIQFTPDLMPSDITGTEIIDEDRVTGKRDYRFIPGPIFANVLLADEINRTPPKTQAALLEAMQEHKVTVAGKTYILDEPFFVLATQNPIEQEGTYPLPEAQLDRFMFNLWLDYPSLEEEKEIVTRTTGAPKVQLHKVLGAKQIIEFQELVRRVPVAENVIDYAARLVGKTRVNSVTSDDYIKKYVRWGAGPRASQFIILAAKTIAIMNGKFAPGIDDVREAVIPVLRHRIITTFTAEAEGIQSVDVINRLVKEL